MDNTFIVNIWWGWVEIDTRSVPCDQGIKGQGRSRWFDLRGNLVKTTEWSDTGAKLIFSAETPKRSFNWFGLRNEK
jgi:hypothetical protein